ncbi:MAG TPA: hypothetical protein PK891_01795, partial [Bacteroidales bacterium]|nr:hypothetical protein [Bacteroidales bacterium]
TLNNVELIQSHLRNSAIYDAKTLISKSTDTIIFGGKKLFIQRCKQEISHEDFQIKKLVPLTSIGEMCKGSNRLFKIVNNKTISFNLNKNVHYELNLIAVGAKRAKELDKLFSLQTNNQIAITYKIDLDYVYLTFDYNILKNYVYKVKQNRVMSLDMNPNSIGWTITDWSNESYHLVKAGTISIKPLNDFRDSKSVASSSDFHKYITNKRNHEIIHIAKDLFTICKHLKCETFAIEKLNMKSSDKENGRRFNKLCNNVWNRNLLTQQLNKHINSSSTTLIEVLPQYTSFIGNLVYRQEHLPDECLSSIEIGRRGFEYTNQYSFKRRLHNKNIVFPEIESVKSRIVLSLEELNIDVPDFKDLKTLYSAVKKSKLKYRFSSSEAQNFHSEVLFSKFHKHKYILIYNYL